MLTVKSLVALAGAGMSFVIRQVDRRFSATSALGWAFYNMFLTIVVASIIMTNFLSGNNLQATLFVPVFCGLWIMLVTLVALTLDSNVLLACNDFSKPLRKLLATGSKESKDSKERETSKQGGAAAPGSEPKSHSSTMFVVNREMFPSRYEEFDGTLLEKILEELNFQRLAVRRVLANMTPATSSTCTADESAERHRTSTAGPHRLASRTKSGLYTGPIDSPKTSNRGLSDIAKPQISIDLVELPPKHGLSEASSRPQEIDISELSSVKIESECAGSQPSTPSHGRH